MELEVELEKAAGVHRPSGRSQIGRKEVRRGRIESMVANQKILWVDDRDGLPDRVKPPFGIRDDQNAELLLPELSLAVA